MGSEATLKQNFPRLFFVSSILFYRPGARPRDGPFFFFDNRHPCA
jgi:hypothetical protein